MGQIDRHKGARQKAAKDRALGGMREELDIGVLMKGNDLILRRKKELEQLGDLLALPDLPDSWRKSCEEWRAYLMRGEDGGSLSAHCHAILQGKYFRYVTMKNAPIPEGWTMKPRKRFNRTKPAIAEFFRDPSLLPKKPPTRKT